jgi:hypothetical protein
MTLALPMIAEWTHHLVYDETATAQYKSGKRDVGNYDGRDCPIGTCAMNGGSKAKDIKFWLRTAESKK